MEAPHTNPRKTLQSPFKSPRQPEPEDFTLRKKAAEFLASDGLRPQADDQDLSRWGSGFRFRGQGDCLGQGFAG